MKANVGNGISLKKPNCQQLFDFLLLKDRIWIGEIDKAENKCEQMKKIEDIGVKSQVNYSKHQSYC